MAMNPEMLRAMQALQQKRAQMQTGQGQTDQAKAALQQKLQGIQDARGMLGQFSRGAPIYNATAPQAQMGGGPQFGPPVGNQNAAAPQMRIVNDPMSMLQQKQQQVAAAQQQGSATGQANNQNPFDSLRKAADTAKSVLQSHQMTDAANQMKQKRSIDMQSALKRRMQQDRQMQAKRVQDSSIRM